MVKNLQELTPQEVEKMRDGMDLKSMTESPGWQLIKKELERLAFHSWTDPREVSDMTQWNYRELNSFYAANNAKELLEMVDSKIEEADYLHSVKTGETVRRRMTI